MITQNSSWIWRLQMPNSSFTVTVIDQWPKLKLVIANNTGGTRDEGPFIFDTALSNFTPAVNNSLRLAVESIIKQRRQQ